MKFKNNIRVSDYSKYENLIENIKQNKTVIFVGAGVSVNIGYRQWDNLLYDKVADGKPSPGLVEYSKLNKKDYDGKSPTIVVDNCINNLTTMKYNSFLKKEFARKSIKQSTNHSLIWQINFQHVITTNFDPCLYDNGSALFDDIKTYPGNRLKVENKRTLYHIHGRAFLCDGENPKRLTSFFKKLIFGEGSYIKAYERDFMIKQFIYNLVLDGYHIFFVGFGWKDIVFNKALESISIAREEFFNSITDKDLKPKSKNIIGTALFHYPTEEEKKLIEDKKGTVHLTKESRDEIKKSISDFKKLESNLPNNGIELIAFDKTDKKFIGLTEIIQLLADAAKYEKIVRPIEQLDASISASVSGSL